jgi:hypothetical protein
MNITELDSYNLADAVKFNDQLNPRIWDEKEHLHPEVRDKLLAIADNFREFLGVKDLAVEDITISGSNAAYTYTPNSDIDLHLVVDVPDDEVYRELFNAKKFQYNEQHDIEIGGADVELYVQDTKEPHISQGVYSVKNNQWVSVPRRVKSVVDDTSTRNKFETLGHQIERAIKSGSVKRMSRMIDKIKRMRQTGLENHGEFGPENLAFKILRNQGLIKQLYAARTDAQDQEFSLAEQEPQQPFVYGFKTVAEASTPDGVSPETKMFLSEEPPADDEGVLRDFVDFCVAELQIDTPPTIKLRRDPQWSVVHKTFGRYTNDRNLLEVAWGQRHIMDVLRTVAHELTHRHQHERDGNSMGPDAGETGSPYENEANAQAGVLMRDYGQLHPELFDSGETHNLDESLRGRAAAAIVAMLLGQPVGASAQSIQGILGMIRDAGSVVQQAQNITRAGLNAEVQQEIVNYVRGLGGDSGSQNLSQLYQIQRQLQQQEPQSEPDPQRREPQNESASGYIPTKRPARDARYSMAFKESWKFKSCTLSSIELSNVLQKYYKTISEQTGNRWYPHRCSNLAQFIIKSQRNLIKENADLAVLFKFQQSLKTIDRRNSVDLQPGKSVAIIQVIPHTADGVIELNGFKIPKKIKNIFSEKNGDIKYVEFNDGSTYPDQHFIKAGKGGGELEGINTLFFPTQQQAEQAVTMIGYKIPNQWQLSTINIDESSVKESASGYIPTKRQARDPRYSMALSTDIKPGQVGREANKLKLKTDRQGHPQIARADGLFEQLMMELRQFQTLDEVRMAPSDLKRFAASPEAQGIRAGFEAELIFKGLGEPEYDEMEPDMDYDERAYSIQQVIDFFQNDDWGYGLSDSQARRVENELDEMYMEWREDQIREDFKHDSEDLISDVWLEERPMEERIHDALTTGLELSDEEADAIMAFHARREGGKIKGSEMSEDELEMASQYSQARSIAMDVLEEDVQTSLDQEDSIYDQALEDYRDNYSGDDERFFQDNGMRYMSDIADTFRLDWPYMTGGGSSEGGWSQDSADRLAARLKKALRVPTKVGGGHHSVTRDDRSWIIEPDSSLVADDPENMAVEIVSPPMPLDECLTKMQEFFAWAESEDAYANSSTGFHMGVSLPTQFHEDVDFVKLVLFLGDEYVLKEFGRSANGFCKSAMSKIRNRLGNDRGTAVSGALDLMKNNLIELAHRSIANNMGFGKYTSVNPKGNYIEFRSAGNSNYFEDLDKLKNTLLRYARAMSIAGNPAAERNEYAKKLYKLVAPSQSDPALSLFARWSAGELSLDTLKREWAELSLEKERPKQSNEREWEAVDPDTGQVLGTTQGANIEPKWDPFTDAMKYFRDVLKLDNFHIREKLPEPTSPRAKLAQRIKQPKAQAKDDEQDALQLQARVDPAVAQVRRDWEFYRAETGAVIDRVSDINMIQANAVRADLVRRYRHPDASVRMRSVPTEASAIRAQARLGEPRPAFSNQSHWPVQDIEPNVAQNFPDTQGTQLTVSGVPSWEIYDNNTNQVVRTFFQRDFQDAMVYAGQWLEANDLGLEGYTVRPTMETP